MLIHWLRSLQPFQDTNRNIFLVFNNYNYLRQRNDIWSDFSLKLLARV